MSFLYDDDFLENNAVPLDNAVANLNVIRAPNTLHIGPVEQRLTVPWLEAWSLRYHLILSNI